MAQKIARKTLYFLMILLIALITALIVDIWLSHYIEKDIKKRIAMIHGYAGSVKVTLFTRALTATNVSWSSTPQPANLREHSLKVKSITATGISLYELFFNKTISFDKLSIDSGHFQFDRSSVNIVSRSGNMEAAPIFKFKSIKLNAVQTQITIDSVVGFRATVNAELKELRVESNNESVILYTVKSLIGTSSNISISRHQGMYGMTIAKIAINTEKNRIEIDSALLIPNYGKYQFARIEGDQASRITFTLPNIEITGFDFNKLADTSWIAKKIEIRSARVHAFKDKRIADIQMKKIPLPMETFIRLPHHIKIDSIIISNATVLVEEFPATGISSGTVTFDHLHAKLIGFNNRIRAGKPSFARINATALLMNTGRINASFDFPLDGSGTYFSRGTIGNMTFASLNPVLKNLAGVQVKSGLLRKLAFDFQYDDQQSLGHVTADYEDLKVTILDKNQGTHNELKTFLANAIVKNNSGGSHPIKPGEIDVKRDKQKQIFNVWSTSVLAGLKSSLFRGYSKSTDAKKRNSQRASKK